MVRIMVPVKTYDPQVFPVRGDGQMLFVNI
jgi:hypothetical protein